MKLRRLFRRLLIAVGIGFLILCLLVVGTFALILYYPQLGRIGGFQELRQSVSLEGTNYVLEVVGSRLQLENTQSESVYVTPTGFDPDNPKLYTLLRHGGNIYLIVGGEYRGGNIGGYSFDIYNITDEPYIVGSESLLPHFSCTYPRLVGDSLEFETAHQCDFYPLFVTDQRTYTVQLK